jgi:hypothetical protein
MSERFDGEDFVVNPAKLFPGDDPKDWADVLSNQGMLRLKVECFYGPSGIQGTIAMANPPSDDMENAWEGSKPPGVWDYYQMLGFIRVPCKEYTIQLFFMEHTFYERNLETIYTMKLGKPDEEVMFEDEIGLEKEWDHIYNEMFVKHFDAESVTGHVWVSE